MGYSVEDRLAQLERQNRRLRAAIEALDASMRGARRNLNRLGEVS
jgi:hypothetical protein